MSATRNRIVNEVGSMRQNVNFVILCYIWAYDFGCIQTEKELGRQYKKW